MNKLCFASELSPTLNKNRLMLITANLTLKS